MGEKEFITMAKAAIVKAFNERKGSLHPALKEEELYVVWLVKALQNNKALLSTSRSGDGLYFEVTNNGDKNEMYLDVYKKQENICVAYENNLSENQNMILDWMLEETNHVEEYAFSPTGIITELVNKSNLVPRLFAELWKSFEDYERQQILMRFLAIKNGYAVS